MLDVTHFTDPGCPWAYSASPAFAVLHWRYGAQLRWTHVLIGLTESAEQYARRGYTPTRSALGYAGYRRFGMPFQVTPKPRLSATSPACRAIVAARLQDPALELPALRALQLAQFTTTGVLEDPETIRAALRRVEGLDADAMVARLDDEDVRAAYEADRARTRTAEGSPTEFQGKAANSDGLVRYTAPSLVFTAEDGRSLEAGGFQPVEAYDVVVANLDPTLERRPPTGDPVEVLEALGFPLTTAEVAAAMCEHLGMPDLTAAEAGLIAATGKGRVVREPVGDGSLWSLA
ncbi:MAG: DsbA family protein [Solirubrobacterales bacterium]|nr:DsbA family protein [Solirubrobacterales bacterium]